MKRMKRRLPNQEMWEHGGRTYSLISLIKYPVNTKGIDFVDIARYEVMMDQMHHDEPIEAAIFDNDGMGVQVLGRYKTFQQARDRIKSGEILDDRSFWS